MKISHGTPCDDIEAMERPMEQPVGHKGRPINTVSLHGLSQKSKPWARTRSIDLPMG